MSKRVPSYIKVYEKIKEDILNGTYPIGSLIPREADLCDLFGVSRTTIRKAMARIEQEGFVHIRQGSGTEVLDYRTTQKLNHVTSFSETLEARGYVVSSKSVHIDFCVPPESILDDLNLPHDSQVIRVQRIQLANGKPITIMTNYIIPELVPGIIADTGKFVSLYKHMESKYGIEITSARDTIKGKAADFLEAQSLELKIGGPLLVDYRITFSHGKPIEAVVMLVDATKYEFSINLSGRPN